MLNVSKTDQDTNSDEYESDNDSDQEKFLEEIDEDLNLIGDVKLDEEDQLLPLDDFCRVYWLIRKHVEPRLEVSLAKLKKRRRRRLS